MVAAVEVMAFATIMLAQASAAFVIVPVTAIAITVTAAAFWVAGSADTMAAMCGPLGRLLWPHGSHHLNRGVTTITSCDKYRSFDQAECRTTLQLSVDESKLVYPSERDG
jgi:hypothetical protein